MIRNCGSQVTRNCLWRDYIREYIVCECLKVKVSQVGCEIHGTKELEARDIKNSLVGL